MAKSLVAMWAVILMVAGVRLAAAADPEALLADAESMPGFLPLYWHSDSGDLHACLLYTSPSPRDISGSRMPSSA